MGKEKRLSSLRAKEIDMVLLIDSIVDRHPEACSDGAYDPSLIEGQDKNWILKIQKRIYRIQKQYMRLGYLPLQ